MISMVERKDIISAYERTMSMRAVSRELGLSRKTVKKYVLEYLSAKSGGDETLVAYLKSEPSYKSATREKRALTGDVCRMIDVCLRDNREKRDRGDRKLCMKATDIHARLKSLGYKVSYPSVCNYIRTTLGNAYELQECFIRQSYPPGRDCEFDWGELYLTIGGRRMKLYMAVFTLAYSNHRAAYLFLQQDTQAYMESHRLYFKMLEKVPHRMVYDNMRVAVASFVGGKHPTDALIRMEAAYRFSHRFCNARSGNEKGHVERSVEFVRRKAFCELDSFDTIQDAQEHLVRTCSELNCPLCTCEGSAEQKLEEELRHMLPMKREISSFEQQSYHVDKYGTIVVRGIHYSVPDDLVGKKVTVFIYSNRIVVYHDRKVVATHEKTPVNGWKLDLMHYLCTFGKKPGSVAGSTALSMASEDLQELFNDHFVDSPSDFVLLLKKTREKGLTLEDLEASHCLMCSSGVRPSLQAFDLFLFGEKKQEMGKPQIGASSKEIEAYASNSLAGISAILEVNTRTINTGGYATTES